MRNVFSASCWDTHSSDAVPACLADMTGTLSDGWLDASLKNLLAWSESVGGQKTKPSQLQSGVVLFTSIITASCDKQSSPAQYNKLLTTLEAVLGNLAAKTYPPSATNALQRALKAMLPILRPREAQHAETKVRQCFSKKESAWKVGAAAWLQCSTVQFVDCYVCLLCPTGAHGHRAAHV